MFMTGLQGIEKCRVARQMVWMSTWDSKEQFCCAGCYARVAPTTRSAD